MKENRWGKYFSFFFPCVHLGKEGRRLLLSVKLPRDGTQSFEVTLEIMMWGRVPKGDIDSFKKLLISLIQG